MWNNRDVLKPFLETIGSKANPSEPERTIRKLLGDKFENLMKSPWQINWDEYQTLFNERVSNGDVNLYDDIINNPAWVWKDDKGNEYYLIEYDVQGSVKQKVSGAGV